MTIIYTVRDLAILEFLKPLLSFVLKFYSDKLVINIFFITRLIIPTNLITDTFTSASYTITNKTVRAFYKNLHLCTDCLVAIRRTNMLNGIEFIVFL